MPKIIQEKFTPIIGLEIHAELKTDSKMFCRCPNGYALQDRPNKVICEICLGHPGTLPVINQQAVDWTVLTALALQERINPQPVFSRKNYFYPDLPKGYQITSQPDPVGIGGYIELNDGTRINIDHLHLEEDTGTLKHPEGGDYSLADYNRSSTPLMELVTEPVIPDAAAAREFCQKYQQILRYLEISDANMEEGQMRCEANISLQEVDQFKIENGKVVPLGNYKLNPKVEVKNINSFKSLERAIEYEIKRQAKALENNESLQQETRGWDDAKQQTFSQRSKEEAHDYRYFPEPDLPPLTVSTEKVEELRATLPELPWQKRARLIEEYGFNFAEADILTQDKKLANYVEETLSEVRHWLTGLESVNGTVEEIWQQNKDKAAKLVANWLINKLFNLLNASGTVVPQTITPKSFADFIALLYENKINSAAGQVILEEMYKTGGAAGDILAEKNLGQTSDSTELEAVVKKIIAEQPQVVADYRSGKEVAIKFLIGLGMRATKGKANPQILEELLKKNL